MSKLQIAILNSSSFGKHFPGHLKRIQSMGEVRVVTVPQDIDGHSLAKELQGIHAVIASVTPRINSDCLNACKDLVLIARHGIGCDNVDLQAATELGILVSRVKGDVEQESVAEMAVGLMLAGGRFMHAGYESVKASRWADRAAYLGPELKGKVIGLFGLGNIGRRVAEILSLGFKAKVIAHDPYLSAAEITSRNAESATFDELISSSEIISLHCPLTNETRRMLSRDVFSRMKDGVSLVNTCRGELLDEDALFQALKDGKMRSYSSDVVEGEPITGEHRLLQFSNVLITPHLGGYSDESLFGMGQTMVDDLDAVLVQRSVPGVLANPAVLDSPKRRSIPE